MYFEGFDVELLQVNGDAYARGLERTMLAARSGMLMGAARRWVGQRLVDLGAALAADPAGRAEPRTASAGQPGC